MSKGDGYHWNHFEILKHIEDGLSTPSNPVLWMSAV